jgi:hypothetical protein
MQPAESMSRELASRIASAVRNLEGVRSVTICGPEGQPLAAVNEPDPARAAALASFLALRAEALPTDGDLRGMGKKLAGSRFLHAAITGGPIEAALLPLQGAITGGPIEAALLPLQGAVLCITHAPGRGQAIAAGLQPIVRRFGATPPARS